MYTRPYDRDDGIFIPESYGGTALRDSSLPDGKENDDPREGVTQNQAEAAAADKNPWENTESENASKSIEQDEKWGIFSFLGKLGFGDFFGNIFKNTKFSLQKIGTEEILILAAAAFLFFSRDGDKECALMLLLLLFIT